MLWKRRRRSRMAVAHERFRKRAAQVRRRPWRFAAAALAALLLVGGVVYLFGYSTVFVVEEVTVEGIEGEFAEQVVTTAAVPGGRPLARVDTAAVEERVLEDLRVAEVAVQRSWPSTVNLVVTPRQPAVAVAQPGSPLQLADASGVVYDTAAERPKGVPQVAVPRGEIDPASLVGAVEMRNALTEDARRKLSKIRVRSNGAIRFDLGAVTVDWGAPDQAAYKASVLAALLTQDGIDPANKEQPVTVDLSAPGFPVVTGMPLAEEE